MFSESDEKATVGNPASITSIACGAPTISDLTTEKSKYCKNNAQCAVSLPRLSSVFSIFERFQKPKHRLCSDFYRFEHHIGKGSTSYVYQCSSVADGDKFAAKHIITHGMTSSDIEMIDREISISSSLNHHAICAVIDVFRTPVSTHIIQELGRGGDLLKRVQDKSFLNEDSASGTIAVLLDAISYIHNRGIVHRDIKLENVLCISENDDTNVKLTDFGLAIYLNDIVDFEKTCGTPQYVPPEMIKGVPYDEKVDIWSLGVLSYTLLCGYFPFHGHSTIELFDTIVAGNLFFHHKHWKRISLGARNFIRCMLQTDPTKRWSADQLRKHPFISGDYTIPRNPSTSIFLPKVHQKESESNLSELAENISLNIESEIHKSNDVGILVCRNMEISKIIPNDSWGSKKSVQYMNQKISSIPSTPIEAPRRSSWISNLVKNRRFNFKFRNYSTN